MPTLTYAERDPEDLDSDGPDHTADSLRYLLMAMEDRKYTSTPALQTAKTASRHEGR